VGRMPTPAQSVLIAHGFEDAADDGLS
jgi:hypothetical protein